MKTTHIVDEVTPPERAVLRLTQRDRMLIAERMRREPRQHFGFEFLLDDWFNEKRVDDRKKRR
jgi:hypothetical protein